MRQVIGRVQSGHEVLSEIVSFGASDDDEPLEPVVISRCGAAVTFIIGVVCTTLLESFPNGT